MMRRSACLFLTVALAALSAPAVAAVTPAQGAKDARVRRVAYDPAQIYDIQSSSLAPVPVVLEPGERIVKVAGDRVFADPKEGAAAAVKAGAWLALATENTIIFKPFAEQSPTMAFVLTVSAEGQTRNYIFQLSNRQGAITDINSGGMAMVQFVYAAQPDPVAVAKAAAAREQRATAETKTAVEAALTTTTHAYALNTRWWKKGDTGCPILAPSISTRVWDDGMRTTLLFAANAPLPSIYTLDEQGTKAVTTPVTTTKPYGLEVTIPAVPPGIRLQRDTLACDLMSDVRDPVGATAGGVTGTFSPNVQLKARP